MFYKPKLTSNPTIKPCNICKRKIAIIGEISSTPPIGGIIPLKIFKKGSVAERIALKGCCSQSTVGNQLKKILIIINM